MKKVLIIITAIFMSVSLTACTVVTPKSYYNSYIDKLESLKDQIGVECLKAEKMCNLAILVWQNTIYEKSSDATDKYTKNGKKFVSDFNVALDNMYADAEIIDSIASLQTNRESIKAEIKAMSAPPPSLKDCYNTLSELYLTYSDLVNLAIAPSGSLNSYNEEFVTVDKNSGDIYCNLDVMIPNKK